MSHTVCSKDKRLKESLQETNENYFYIISKVFFF